jgi:hypothetical protein
LGRSQNSRQKKKRRNLHNAPLNLSLRNFGSSNL